jgi:PRTRC genetic system protein A
MPVHVASFLKEYLMTSQPSSALLVLWQRHLACHLVWPECDLPPYVVSGRDYLLAHDGLYVRAERPELAVRIPVAPCTLAGLGQVTPAVHLRVPRVPAQLVTHLVREAQAAREATGRLVEQLCYLVYDDGWVYYVPPQERHPTALHADLAEAPAVARDMARSALIEVHTHGSLPPFFSAVDDRDERGGFRISVVIGHLDRVPHGLARVGVFGHAWPIPLDLVLDLPDGLLLDAGRKG